MPAMLAGYAISSDILHYLSVPEILGDVLVRLVFGRGDICDHIQRGLFLLVLLLDLKQLRLFLKALVHLTLRSRDRVASAAEHSTECTADCSKYSAHCSHSFRCRCGCSLPFDWSNMSVTSLCLAL